MIWSADTQILAIELGLGITIVSAGGRTTVPERVREMLGLESTAQRKGKILWAQEGNEIVVRKGTPQSSFRKTLMTSNGRAAIPKHIRKALKLKPTLRGEERIVWLQKGDKVVVRKGRP